MENNKESSVLGIYLFIEYCEMEQSFEIFVPYLCFTPRHFRDVCIKNDEIHELNYLTVYTRTSGMISRLINKSANRMSLKLSVVFQLIFVIKSRFGQKQTLRRRHFGLLGR